MGDRLRRMTDQLAFVETLLLVLDHREEVLDIVSLPDRALAQHRLEEQFAFPALHARALLEAPQALWTEQDLRQLQSRAADLRRRIRQEEQWPALPEPRPASRNLDAFGPNDVTEARRVLEPIVRSVIRPEELSELDLYWSAIPDSLYPPRSGRGGSPGDDADEGSPVYLWIRILAQGEEFCINIWSPSYRDPEGTISWFSGVLHLADSLEDWASEKVAPGEQRRVDDELLPSPD